MESRGGRPNIKIWCCWRVHTSWFCQLHDIRFIAKCVNDLDWPMLLHRNETLSMLRSLKLTEVKKYCLTSINSYCRKPIFCAVLAKISHLLEGGHGNVHDVEDPEKWFLVTLQHGGSPQRTCGCKENASEHRLLASVNGHLSRNWPNTPNMQNEHHKLDTKIRHF